MGRKGWGESLGGNSLRLGLFPKAPPCPRQLTYQPEARGPGRPWEQVTICLSPHSLLQGPHKYTHTHTHPNIYQKKQ